MPQYIYPWEEDQPQPQSPTAGHAAAAVRGGAVTAVPALIRLGSNFGAVEGGLLGAGISGAGETIAQMIENGSIDPHKLNLKRIALEAGLGAIPAAKLIKEGKAATSAALGGGAALAGVVGRKLTSDNPDEGITHWDSNDALNVGIGALMGGAIGKMTTPAPEDAVSSTLRKVLGTGTQDAVDKAGPRLTKPTSGLRVGTAQGAPIYADTAQDIHLPANQQAPIVQEAERRAAMVKDRLQPISDLDQAIDASSKITKAQRTANDRGDKAFLRRTNQGWQQEARNANATEKYLKGVAKETDRESLAIERQRNLDWAQEAKNLNAKDAYARAQANAAAVEKRLQELQDQGAQASTTVTKTSSMDTPEGPVKATTVIRPAPAAEDDLPPAPPAAPTPKPGVFQVVRADGKVVEATDPATAEALVNAAGPGSHVVLPPEALTPPPVEPKAPKKGVKAPPVAPASAKVAKVTETNPSLDALESIMERTGGAGVKSVPGTGTLPAEPPAAPITGTATQLVKALDTPAQPPTTLPEGVKLSAPLAMRVAQAEGDVPAGQTIARFFRNKDAALKAGAYNEELPDQTIGLLNSLLGRAEVTPRSNEARGHLWDMIGKIRNELDLPQFPRGSKVQPSLKLVPEAERVAARTAAAAPIADVPRPGVTILPGAAPVPPAEFPPIQTGRPLTPDLRSRIDLNLKQQRLLESTGRLDTPEYAQLAKEANQLQIESFAQQHPDLVKELQKRTKGSSNERGAIDPSLLVRLAPTAIGAGIGAATDKKDRTRGAILGGLAGYAGGAGLEKLAESGKPVYTPGATWQEGLARNLSGIQRFNYLTDPQGIAYNTIAAPLGAGTLGSLERVLVGKAEQAMGHPGGAEKATQGMEGLRQLYNTYVRDASTTIPDAWKQAQGLIQGANERAERLPGEAKSLLDELLAKPGEFMTTGDVLARGALGRAGVPDDIARAMTVTANPRYWLGEKISEIAKRPAGQFILPFARTAVNIAEGSIERTPIIGFLANLTNDPAVKATMTELITRQGLGAGVTYAAYQIGKHTDPELDKSMKLGTLLSNMAGQYGLLARAGYEAGLAARLGKVNSIGDFIHTAAPAYAQGFPLPTTRAPLDLIQSAGAAFNGQPVHPTADTWTRQHLPYSLTPGFVPPIEKLFQSQSRSPYVYPWEH